MAASVLICWQWRGKMGQPSVWGGRGGAWHIHRYLLKRNGNTIHKKICTRIFLANLFEQKLEITKCPSIGKQTTKTNQIYTKNTLQNPQTGEYLYNGILLGNKKEWIIEICNMNNKWKHYAELKKSNTHKTNYIWFHLYEVPKQKN